MFVLLLATTSVALEFPRLRLDLKKILPSGWMVSDVDTRGKPYGWDQTFGPDAGLRITFLGTNDVLDKAHPVKESLTIWVMNNEFTPKPLTHLTPHFPASLLGSNDLYTVYALPWADMPGWTNWQHDLSEALKIK